MVKPRQVLIMLLGIVAAACASQTPHQNLKTATRALPVKQIYMVIAADPMVSTDPGYLTSMEKFQRLLRKKIQQAYPDTGVILGHSVAGTSAGWDMMIDVQDFNYVSARQRFSGDSHAGSARLRVHVQLTDVHTRKTFDNYILGTAPSIPDNKIVVGTTNLTAGTDSVAAQFGNSNTGVTTGQLLEKVSTDIARSLDKQALAVHQPQQ